MNTTLGIYRNSSYIINGVKDENLEDHIEYNKTNRGGRALVVNGEIVFCGYWKKEELEKFIEDFGLKSIVCDEDTAPYN